MKIKKISDVVWGVITISSLIPFLLSITVYRNNIDIRMFVLEILLCMVGFAGLIFNAIDLQRKTELIEKGKCIEAKITKVESKDRHFFTRNKKYNILVEAINPVTNEKETFISDIIYFDPTETIKAKNLNSLYLYVNENDPTDYYIDLNLLA